jgi:hypothetical protein
MQNPREPGAGIPGGIVSVGSGNTTTSSDPPPNFQPLAPPGPEVRAWVRSRAIAHAKQTRAQGGAQ